MIKGLFLCFRRRVKGCPSNQSDIGSKKETGRQQTSSSPNNSENERNPIGTTQIQNTQKYKIYKYICRARKRQTGRQQMSLSPNNSQIKKHLLNLVTVSSSTKIAAACLLNLASVNSIIVHFEGWSCAENIINVF